MKHLALALTGLYALLPMASGIDLLTGYGVRVKDVALIEGARPNQLRGLGLVTGLDGNGDSSKNSIAHLMVKNMLVNFDVIGDNTLNNLSNNNASVMVYAEIPPFAKPGTKLDVHVAAIGGAESLQGGFLEQSPLKGADGKVYAVAQGAITTGTFEFGGRGARVSRGGSTTIGTVAQGAIVEEEIPVTMLRGRYLHLNLKSPDFTTATRVAEVVNATPLFKEQYPKQPAEAVDAATIRIEIPEDYQEEASLVRLITKIENMYVEVDQVARIVVNERTGTIVVGQHVRISTVAVAHGGLTVAITESPLVSQPGAFAERGETTVVERTGVEATESNAKTHLLKGGLTVSELASALNALGASPRDIIAILQAIKAAGGLQAELVIM